MTESEVIYLLTGLLAGAILGILLTLGFNKLRAGRVSAAGVRKEMDEYQAQVEAHFEETSKKFKSMSEQYKDLYQHLSVGATTLCRPDNVAAGLTDQSDPLQSALKIEAKAAQKDESASANNGNMSSKAEVQGKKTEPSKTTDKATAGAKEASASKEASGKAAQQPNKPKQQNSTPQKPTKGESGKSAKGSQNASSKDNKSPKATS